VVKILITDNYKIALVMKGKITMELQILEQ